MAYTINGITVLDDTFSPIVSAVVLNTYGSFSVISANTAPTTTPPAAGTVSGYASGGINPSVPAFRGNISKFPFAADGNATNVASLSTTRRRGGAVSSETHGYAVSGDSGATLPTPAGAGFFVSIDRFPFATDTNATISGSMNFFRTTSGIGCASPTHGYVSAGRGVNNWITDTERFAFAADNISTIVGGAQWSTQNSAEYGSLTSGYIVSGNLFGAGSPTPSAPPAQTYQTTAIQKYAFANESDAVQVGDTILSRFLFGCVASVTHGYAMGGASPTPVHRYKTIDKMPFAAEGTGSFVGDLSSNNASFGTCSSTSAGYVLGGAISNNPPAPVVGTNNIDKFPFATDANASDVGDLTEALVQTFGNQN